MKLLRILLFPFSLIYGGIIYLRNRLYDLGIFKSESFDVPTINVGNLALGGSGKSPHVAWLVKHFSTPNTAILSRGYGRKTSGFKIFEKGDTSSVIGDEPLMYAKKFPGVIVAVSEKRVVGMKFLQKLSAPPEIIILDDAFQHRAIQPKVNLLLTTWQKPFWNDLMLPTGTLRDNKMEAKRANAIIITKCPFPWQEEEMEKFRNKCRKYKKPVFFSRFRYSEITNLNTGENFPNEKLREYNDALIITAIANPSLLEKEVEKYIPKFTALHFRDHHAYTTGDIEKANQIIDNFAHSNNCIITTEKDAVKLLELLPNGKTGETPVLTLNIEVEFYNESSFSSYLSKLLPHP